MTRLCLCMIAIIYIILHFIIQKYSQFSYDVVIKNLNEMEFLDTYTCLNEVKLYE